jgi:hypothetical protein
MLTGPHSAVGYTSIFERKIYEHDWYYLYSQVKFNYKFKMIHLGCMICLQKSSRRKTL